MNLTKTTLALLGTLAVLAACETTAGLGRDTSKLGNDVTGTAQKATPKPSSTGN